MAVTIWSATSISSELVADYVAGRLDRAVALYIAEVADQDSRVLRSIDEARKLDKRVRAWLK